MRKAKVGIDYRLVGKNTALAEVNTAILAADLSMGRDDYGMRFFKTYRERKKKKIAA